MGEGKIKSSAIQSVTYDARATARVETRNTMYVVGPTGWTERPADHPFNNPYSKGMQIKVEWNEGWWDAIIRDISGESYLIHYIGFDSSWDEWVGTSRMKVVE